MRTLQINLTLDAELAKQLGRFMQRRKLRKNATAVKELMREALESEAVRSGISELRSSLGCAVRADAAKNRGATRNQKGGLPW